jgi:hypothetical protein
MATIDGWLEGYLHGPAGLGLIILVSLALGLRHASDPDHLAAVTTLIASEEHRKPARKAGLMGLLWGLGHGTTLLVLGLPLVLAGRHLPNLVQQAAETLIGALIVLLAARLLLRWRRGLFHTHPTPTVAGESTPTSTRTKKRSHTVIPTPFRLARHLLRTALVWCMASAVRAGSRCCFSRPYPTLRKRPRRS